MPQLVEKRSIGRDRRVTAGMPPRGGRERRVADRRQYIVKEISFREWALQVVRFQKRLDARRKRESMKVAREYRVDFLPIEGEQG